VGASSDTGRIRRGERARFGALAETLWCAIIARLRPQLAAATVFDMLQKTTGWQPVLHDHFSQIQIDLYQNGKDRRYEH